MFTTLDQFCNCFNLDLPFYINLKSRCEIIRDQYTGSSLQYGFVEFEKKEDCEAAYLKMDNVLIDDRRIHVDFSQSVSKKLNCIF